MAKCSKSGECEHCQICIHAHPHECENAGYAMECIYLHGVVQCLEDE